MDDTTAMHGIGRNFQQMNVGGADRQFISPTASMADSSNKFLSEMFSSMRTAPVHLIL